LDQQNASSWVNFRSAATLLDHCQVGFAVMSIIGELSFFCVEVKKPEDLSGVSGFGWGQP
jgi:hypothetical protein